MKLVVNLLYRIFSLFRKKSEVVFACNFMHDIYHNLSAIHTQFREKNTEERVRYLTLNKSSIISILSNIWHIAAAKIIVVDCTHWVICKIDVSRQSKLIYLGHGGGVYKKMGYAKISAPRLHSEETTIRRKYGQFNYVCTTTEYFKDKICLNYHIKENQILCLGLPRTDLIFSNIKSRSKHSKITVLLAPSFLEVGRSERRINWDFDSLDNELSKINVKVIISIHPDIRKEVKIPESWINASEIGYPYFLLDSDILITDNSSLMFDFSCTKRPVILLLDNEINCEENWPTIDYESDVTVCCDLSRINTIIQKALELKTSESLFKKQMNACNGYSTENLCNFIKDIL